MTKRLVAVVVGFACCWLPIFIIDNIDMAHGEPTLPRPAYLAYGFLLYLSSTITIITQPGHDCLSFDVVFIIIIHCKGEIVALNYVKLEVTFFSEIFLIKRT